MPLTIFVHLPNIVILLLKHTTPVKSSTVVLCLKPITAVLHLVLFQTDHSLRHLKLTTVVLRLKSTTVVIYLMPTTILCLNPTTVVFFLELITVVLHLKFTNTAHICQSHAHIAFVSVSKIVILCLKHTTTIILCLKPSTAVIHFLSLKPTTVSTI